MRLHHDPELDDVLQDDELRRLATLLSSAARPEPPVDDAFRSGLRRQLMQHAWSMSEGRDSWWRRAFAPPGLAWLGAAAGVVLIASVASYMALQPPGGLTRIVVSSSMDGTQGVALRQPILVSFNQPMNHSATEAAVQVAPATTVTFSWSSNNLYVQPANGNLAPNTQYQVTIGPGARTEAGQQLSAPATITFVTQPPAAPTETLPPKPSPSPGASPLGEKQLAPLGGTATAPVQWSADSSTVYFVSAKGALGLVPAKGGDVTMIAPDGVSSPSISPTGDRLAYIRSGKIEVLTFAAGTNVELVPTPAPTLLGWADDKLVWAAADGIYKQGATAPAQLAPLPVNGTVTVLSIAPDGGHVAYQQDQKVLVLDLATGKSTALGQPGARFLGWSPDGSLLLYSNDGSAVLVAGMQGNATSTLPGGEPAWSSQDAILLGSDTDLHQLRPDGTSAMKLSNGTYHSPQWAPNGAAFVFFRGGQLWTATAPALPPQPTVLDQATTVVNSFMQARLKGQSDLATTFLNGAGKQAYAAGTLNLTMSGDPAFTRYYILTQEVTGAQPDAARFVVRLVLTHERIDVSDFDETLRLVRDPTTNKLLVDQATAGAHRDLGKGAEVVGVAVTPDTIQITFDSDLDPATVTAGIVVLDAKGKPIGATLTYASKLVTITGLDLKPGAPYRLVVLTTVRDVLGHNVAAEYDLDLVGPAAKNHHGGKQGGTTVTVSPSPTPAATPAG
jgi:Tol biopolymer transport system component